MDLSFFMNFLVLILSCVLLLNCLDYLATCILALSLELAPMKKETDMKINFKSAGGKGKTAKVSNCQLSRYIYHGSKI